MAYFGSFTSSVDQLGNNYKEFLAKLQLPLPAPTPTDFSPAESDRCHVEDLQDEERDEDGGGESGGEENQNQNNQTNAEEGQQKKANGNKSKKQKVDEPTICEVCGQKAEHFHYGVVSCKATFPACYVFFRRAIINDKHYLCKVKKSTVPGSCAIFKGAKCNACRFDRCVKLGMTLYTMKLPPSVDRTSGDARIERRRAEIAAAQDSDGNDLTDLRVCNSGLLSPTLFLKSSSSEAGVVAQLLFVESKHKRVHYSADIYNFHELYGVSLRQVLERGVSVLHKAEKFKNYPPQQLTDPVKMTELFFPPPGSSMKVILNWKPPTTYLIVDIYLAIELMKTMPAFSQLDLESKEMLIRHVIMTTFTLNHAYYSWVDGYDTITMPNGIMPASHKNQLPALGNRAYTDVMLPLKRVRLSPEEFVLLRAIILSLYGIRGLKPDAQRLLEAESEKYSQALMEFCQRKYGLERGATRYAEVLLLADSLFVFANMSSHIITYITMAAKIGLMPFPSAMFVEDCIAGNVKLPDWD